MEFVAVFFGLAKQLPNLLSTVLTPDSCCQGPRNAHYL